MASVHDTAAYILKKRGPMTAMKLQKLVYYAQAWSLVWDERPLFSARIEAWAFGPVVPELYKHHRTEFNLTGWDQGSAGNLTAKEKETVDAVLDFYGGKSAQWLSDLSHREDPWKKARKGVPDGQRGSAEITRASMAEYYQGLLNARR